MITFFFMLTVLGMIALLAASTLAIKNPPATILCMRHVWRRKDAKGWLPDPCEDFERVKKAPLTCATCGLVFASKMFEEEN